MILRDYQKKASNAVFDEWKECDTTLLVLPTGCGKTVVFSDIIRRIFPKRVMVLAHREELIWQAKQTITAVTGLRTEVEMGEYRSTEDGSLFRSAPVVISSIQTHTAGGDGGGRMGKFDPQRFGALIIDEAHHSISPSYRRTIEYYRTNPKLKVLGVTATPDRGDEEALGQVFESVAFNYEIYDAIRDGYLVPINQQLVTVSELDFSGIRTKAGDLNGADLAAVMESEKPLQGVAGPSIEIIGNRQAIVFASSVNHARMLSEIFNRHKPGISRWVCGKTDKDERKKINSDFRAGAVQILCNCGTHTEGFDADVAEVVIMARPTESRSLYAQMAGRATRPLKGTVDGIPVAALRRLSIRNSAKPSCLIVDFVGNSGKHKLISSVDILGGNVSEDTLERVRTQACLTGKSFRVDVSIEEEEKRAKEAEARRLEEEARRHRLTAKTKWSSTVIDPFDVFQIKPVVSRGWDEGKVLTEKQRNFLRRGGINPDKLEYAQAKQLIREMMERIDKKLCTFGQAKILRKFGLPTDCSFDVASKAIDTIAKNGWQKPKDFTIQTSEPVKIPDKVPVRQLIASHAPIEQEEVPF